MKIVECVPNFSEGRREEVIESIRKAAESVPGITVLDCESDPNHNRMVLTFVGSPEAVVEAALASSQIAIGAIDLRTHKGEHPRMGAVDVVPFVPLRGITMEECVGLANSFAREFSVRFQVPVFMYEEAAKRPERRDLFTVRRGQFESLRELIGKDPSREPDYGPSTIHPSAGATAVGARQVLIAYNVNLGTDDLQIAKKIAHSIRERDGGLPKVKALGFLLSDRSIVQVSMNLTDYRITSMAKAFDAIEKECKELGVAIVESELVGLAPMAALTDAAVSHLKLANFKPNQIIENRLFGLDEQAETTRNDFSKMSLEQFMTLVSSREPTPGGGTVSAVAGALAASLVVMVCNLTLGKKGYESNQDKIKVILDEASSAKEALAKLAERDSYAFQEVSKAYALPRSSEEQRQQRKKAIGLALKEASVIPADTMRESFKVFKLAVQLAESGNKNAMSDIETAVELARAATRGAWSNIALNLQSLKEERDFSMSLRSELEPLLNAVK
ncbi:MAG: glutamate formimidoyltransferase [Nitrososphaerales archaeon]